MTRPLSKDIRKRVVAAVEEEGMSRRSAAARFGVAASTAIKWVDRWRRTGSVAARPMGGDNRSHRIERYAGDILAVVEETPDVTLAELKAYLAATHGLRVSESMIWRLLDRHGLTFKKNRARHRAATS